MRGKHLPGNCLVVWGVGRKKKARQRATTSASLAPKDLTLFASDNEISVISSFVDNANPSLDGA